MKSSWLSFATSYQKNDIRLYNLLTIDSVELKADSVVHFGLYNELQIESFEKVKRLLLRFLVQKLRNSSITIKTYLIESANIPKPLTKMEKFEQMAQKNNALKIFRERLGLDFE